MRARTEQDVAIERGAERYFGARADACILDSRMKSCLGFTLIELISVMVIVGILAAVAIPRLMDSNSFEARGAADQVTAALRYGQKVAIAQQRNISVKISSAGGSNCSAVLAGTVVNCVITNSVTVAPVTVVFNPLGQPVPSNVPVTVTVGTTTIHVEAETGYVH